MKWNTPIANPLYCFVQCLNHEPEQTSHFAHEFAAEMPYALNYNDRICRNDWRIVFRIFGRHVYGTCLTSSGGKEENALQTLARTRRAQALEETFEIFTADNHVGILIRYRKRSRSLCFQNFVGEPGNCGELPIPITISGAGTDLHHARSRLAKHNVGQRRAMWRDNHTRAGEQVCLFPPGKIFGFDNFEIPIPQDL